MFVSLNSLTFHQHGIRYATNSVSFTALHTFDDIAEAIEDDDMRALKRVSDFTKINKDLKSFLHISADCGNVEISEMLLEKGLSPNQRDKKGNTPFLIACKRKNPQLIQMFIDKGADIDSKGLNGNTGLHYAASSPETMKFLLDNNANPYILNDDGVPVLHVAATSKKSLEFLLANKINPDSIDAFEQTICHLGARNGSKEILNTALGYGAEVNFRDKLGNTPIFYSKNSDIVRFLVNNKAAVNVRNAEDESPLFYMVRKEDYDSVQELLNAKAKLNFSNIDNKTALCYAKTNSMRELLLKSGAFPDVPLIDNKTYLHLAADKDDIVTLKLFLKYKANPNLEDEFGAVPLDYTKKDEARVALLDAGSNPNRNCYLHFALNTNNTVFADKLLECKADVTMQLPDGRTTLFMVQNPAYISKLVETFETKDDVVKFINHQDEKGNTALHHFSMNGRDDLVSELSKYNPDRTIRNNAGYTADDLYDKFKKYDKWIK